MTDQEMLEQFQILVSMIEKLPTKEYVEERIIKKIEESQHYVESVITQKLHEFECHMEILLDEKIANSYQQLASRIDESRRHTEILIENNITKRLDSLNDGYKLNHEKQFELERKIEALLAKHDTIEQRLFALESKNARIA
jgi:hypothetical protein